MAYYNVPTGNQTNGLYEIFKFIGVETTAGLFFPIMILVVWAVAFMGLKQYSSSKAWTFASFFSSFLAIMMSVLDLMSPKWMYLCIFLTLIGFVWIKLENTTG